MSGPIPKLTEALIAAQREFQPALKESVNPHFKSRYVDLAGVWNACRDALHSHGLTVVQTVAGVEGGASILRSILLHTSGEQIASEYPLCPVKNDPQGMGSAMTYARRYSLAALVGIAPEDDDGEAGHGRQPSTQGNAPAAQRQPAQGAAPVATTTTTTPPKASTATTSTTKATAADPAAERQARANYEAQRAGLPGSATGPAIPSPKERAEAAYRGLKVHGEKVALAFWKASGASWEERCETLELALAGLQHGLREMGEEGCYPLVDKILTANGWPNSTPEQVRAIAHHMAAIKPSARAKA